MSHPCDHHNHHHSHHHSIERRIGFVFWLNSSFALVELVGGFYTNSFAVMSSALHDFSDSLALALALYLEKKSKNSTDAQYSYGYRRFSIASAFLTAVFLVSGSVLVIGFAINRLFQTQEVTNSNGMLVFSILGIGMNLFSLLQLRKGKSLNERVLSWHFIEDISSWALVLVGSLLIKWQNWYWLDTVIGLLSACWILWNVRKNLTEAMRIFLQAAPQGLSLKNIQENISQLQGVQDIHHLHVWTMDGEKHILTAHILVDKNHSVSQLSELKSKIKQQLLEVFHISEATLELEWPNEVCADPTHL
jgi:cobalt-zinc-cadmium efflux system protein